MHGNKDSIVREFLAACPAGELPLFDGGRADDDAVMASDKVPILGVKVDRGPASDSVDADRARNPDANEAGWYLKHKGYGGSTPEETGSSQLPSE